MKMNKCVKCLAVLLAVVLLSSCGREVPKEEKPPTKNNGYYDIVVKDSTSIYKDDDDDSVVCMYLTVMKGNDTDNTNYTWEDVNSHSVYYYSELGIKPYAVNGILQVGDENGPAIGQLGYGEFAPNCRVKIRGKTSSRSPQKNYRIDINKNEGYWRGQSTVNLNKHVYDVTRMRNKLSYDLIKTIPGMIGARTQFVRLFVKDQTVKDGLGAKFVDYGIFTQIEQINKTYLRNHGLDEFGHLYKAEMFEFNRYEDEIKLSTDPLYDQSLFETRLEIKGDTDHTKLIEMLTQLNDYNVPIEDIMEQYFDEENYFTWLAFQILTANRDTTTQNFYLYSPLHSQKWYFISWDNDAAWRYNERLTFDGLDGSNYEYGVSNYFGSVLHQRVLKSEKMREKLDKKVKYLMGVLTKDRLKNMINSYLAVVKSFVFQYPDIENLSKTSKQYDQIISMMPDDVQACYELYKGSLKKPMPFFLDMPRQMGDSLVFAWDMAYDFDNQKVVYNFDLSQDCNFASTIYCESDVEIPQIKTQTLSPGQYFYRVTCKNEDGETQTAMEQYVDANDVTHYGVLSFYVMPDGAIQGG